MSAQLKPGLYVPCSICTSLYRRYSSLQRTCGDYACQSEARRQRRLKQERKARRKELRNYRERSKTIGQRLQETQRVYNRWIVQVRDKAAGCICCDVRSSPVWHAGHYRPTSSHSALRFDPANVHKQASKCNLYLSGNLTAYRERLVQKIGLAEVERLESDSAPHKWTHEELKAIKAEYSRRLREARKHDLGHD